MKLLHDDKFKHVDYKHTDLRKTFARVRKQQEADRRFEEQKDAEAIERLNRVFPNLRRVQ
jgi:hypothetical protein